ncbi:MAG: VWA domain-containing protein [Armatimonadota bacterium]|nr:VWA domain-containing protein [Armatimonadota bacterium]MDR7451591.1 VWA domain-containing protein [Armatimonadota bacterium]MDR7467689.1 VWA domain-containing protein [Armatimonadota bacterium]MDR7492560.1 VWA domain-containing protein [Armatimonadota bacterium]MDR7500493.1 VWA domain-containing protein [Armatimonadota bacterium]
MTFDAPQALWGLLALPFLVLLYMLRPRRQEVPVSTLILWQRARRDLAARRPARRIERSLLLLLQLVAVTLVVAALARPRLALPGAGEIPIVIIVDTSASMQATDESPSRFAVAVERARRAAAAARGQVMLIAAGARPSIVVPFADPLLTRGALDRLRPTDGPGRLDQAITLALGQRVGGLRPRVEVFTDRAGAALPGVTYHTVGRAARNVGIVAVNVEREAQASAVVVQVHNAGETAAQVPILVTLDGRRLPARTVTVGPQATASAAVSLSGAGVARIELAVDEDLAVDNVAHAVVGTPPPRVIVAGAPDRVLAEALAAIPVRVLPPQRITPEALAVADVVILNRTPPVDLPPGNYLLLGTVASNLPLGVTGRVRVGPVLRWTGRHPVMRYVDLTDVTIGEALRLEPRGGEVLAEGTTPLIWAYEGDGVRALVTAFSLEQSDLPLRVGFPIFLSNALSWLGGAEPMVQAGDTVTIPSGSVAEAVVTGPDGEVRRVAASGGRVVLPTVEHVGLYTVRIGDRDRRVVVNPAAEEVAIAPLAPRSSGSEDRAGGSGQSREAWRAVLLLALIVVCSEWLLWLRTLPKAGAWGQAPRLLHPRKTHG